MVGWQGDTQQFSLSTMNLQPYPFFEIFDENYFYAHLLPQGPITYRYDQDRSVDGTILDQIINDLIDNEINKKAKTYIHFDILQDKDFNRRKICGLLILKFKEYPFVVKLFIEDPHSFVNPWSKGFEPIFFFYLGGGVNRHLSGFTRIKNLAYINKKIDGDPYWSTRVSTPRKWYWAPKNLRWLSIVGTNIGGQKELTTRIPGTYAIIADAIKTKRSFSSFNHDDMQTALSITNLLEANLDLHISNFMVEDDGKIAEGSVPADEEILIPKNHGVAPNMPTKQHKEFADKSNLIPKLTMLDSSGDTIVIIDTEHFPTMVGLRETRVFTGYASWYTFLIGKCAHDMLFSTKKERYDAQKIIVSTLAPYASIDVESRLGSQHCAPPSLLHA